MGVGVEAVNCVDPDLICFSVRFGDCAVLYDLLVTDAIFQDRTDLMKEMERHSLESVVQVEGVVQVRPEGQVNEVSANFLSIHHAKIQSSLSKCNLLIARSSHLVIVLSI